MPRLDPGPSYDQPLDPQTKIKVQQVQEIQKLADQPVRSTGETFGGWFSRRLQLLDKADLKLTDKLDLASQPIPDEALKALTAVGSKFFSGVAQSAAEGEKFRMKVLRKAAEDVSADDPEAPAKVYAKASVELINEATRQGISPHEQDYWISEHLRLMGLVAPEVEGPSVFEASSTWWQEIPLLREEYAITGEVMKVLSQTVQTVHGISEGIAIKTGLIKNPQGYKPESILGIPTTVTPRQAYERADQMGSGAAVAYQAGAEPGTKPFIYTSVGFDIWAGLKGSPFNRLGQAGAVLKEAGVAANIASSGRYKGFQQVIARLAEQTPEQIMNGPVARQGIRQLTEDIQRFASGETRNVNALLERNPALANVVKNRQAGGTELVHDLIDAGLQGEDELRRAVTDLMEGTLTGQTRTRLQGRLNGYQDELEDAEAVFAKDPTNKVAKTRVDDIRGRVQGVKNMLDAPPGASVVMDRVPNVSTLKRIRQNTTRKEQRLQEMIDFSTEDNWATLPFADRMARAVRRPKGLIPTQGVSKNNLVEGREHMTRLGRNVLGLSAKRTDEFVNDYLAATSVGEARDAYLGMIEAGAKNLPPGLRTELTRIADDVSNTTYHVDKVGRAFKGWVKKTVRQVRGKDVEIEYDQPGLWSERAQEFALPNYRGILEARSWQGKIRHALKGEGENALARIFAEAAPESKFAGRTVAEAWRLSQHITSMITSGLWVPAALFRLGWTLRVIGDEQMRLMAIGMSPLDDSPGSIFGRIGRVADTPEEALTDLGRMMVDARPAKGISRIGDPRYWRDLQASLLKLNADPVVRKIIEEGGDTAAVVRWLETDGSEFADDMADVLQGVARKDGGRGVGLAEWVEHQKRILDDVVGGSEDLKDLIGTGSLSRAGVVAGIKDEKLLNVLKSLPADELPVGVPQSGSLFDSGGPQLWERMKSAWFRYAGSKPTNYLSRSRAFHWFNEQELKRYKSLGITGKGAENAARDYAIKQVGEILYDSAQRTAGDLALKNWAPFLPAWKEVLTRWTHAIPGRMGQGLGQAVLLRRLQITKDALEDAGILYKNQDGEWVIKIPGMDEWLSDYFGIKTKGEISVQSLNMIGNFPFGGPVTATILAEIAKGHEGFQKILEPLYPFGFELSGGPAWVSRTLRGLGLSELARVNELMASEYQDILFEGSRIDWMRTQFPRMDRIASMPVENAEQRTARANELRKFVNDSEKAARGIYLKRGVLGFFAPAQPRLYWEGQKEASEFWTKFNALDPNNQSPFMKKFKDQNPGLQLYFQAKSMRLKGERERSDGINEYWADYRKKNLKRWTPEEWGWLSVGNLSEQAIRTKYREALADVGTSYTDWLVNADEVSKIQAERDKALNNLNNPLVNGFWLQVRGETFDRAAVRDGKPLATLDEERWIEAGRLLKIIDRDFAQLPDTRYGDEKYDTSGYRNKLRVLKDTFSTDRLYTDKELPPGIERDIAQYMDAYYGYYDKIAEIRAKADNAKTREDASRAFLEIRRFKESYVVPTIDDKQGPTPEEYSYLRLNEDQRKAQRVFWTSGRIQWLSKFQRKELGLNSGIKAVKAWEAIEETEIAMNEFIRSQGWSSFQKEAKNVRAVFKEWAQSTAQWGGVAEEYEWAEKPRYERLDKVGLLEGVWTSSRVKATVDAAWSVLRSAEQGADGKMGKAIKYLQLYPWIEAVRSRNPELDRALTDFQIWGKKNNHYAAYDWLFFED